MTPTVSVVVCTYNGSAYVEQQFASLLAQSRLPDQIVIADDASSDGTPEAIERFAARCRGQGVEVVLRLRPANVGFIANFADALTLATGDLIFLCDQDDRWHEEKLARMAATLAEEPDLTLLFTDARLVDAAGAPLGQTLFDALELLPADWHALRSGHAFPVLLRRAVVTGATTAFRQPLVRRALPVPPGWIHDEWLATVAALTGRILPLSSPLIDYRQHGGNQIGMRKRTWRQRIADLFLPRNALLIRGLERMAALDERFAEDAMVPLASRQLVTDRMRHFRRRVAIGSRPRYARWPDLWSEWQSGGYRRHGNGLSSVLRDALRKH
ncbi:MULTISPECIES: glycosyltransferase family 2 protein [unclassified Luteibacter]|uniref:glycosyltransferase family 2 protein n=1 Tax=Luteibacter sp. PvP019 TaxID=3156436 RepID=UPI0033954FA5